MPRRGYRSLVIPESLYKSLVDLVEASNGRYVSASEVVRKAVWELIEREKAAD